MSTSATSPGSGKSLRATKVVIPKVWKRPHSTIYGKNVEFGSKLYSDKIGEINGRKFNSELPWQVRNTGNLSTASTSSSGSQGYISSLLLAPESTLLGSVVCARAAAGGASSSSASGPVPSQLDCHNYADMLALTNPNKYSPRMARALESGARRRPGGAPKEARVDFYAQYLDPFNRDVHQMSEQSVLMHEPLLHRRTFDKYLDFNHEIGLFVPSQPSCGSGGGSGGGRNSLDSSSSLHRENSPRMALHEWCSARDDGRSMIYKKTLDVNRGRTLGPKAAAAGVEPDMLEHVINNSFTPVCTTTQQTSLLPKHSCQLASSPYGPSADGRKLSLGSINPHSYRPSARAKSSTLHASDGEEFEFQDRSSPFYTDRWAGKTIRHFDSDLYSNANLFKSMIL